MNYPDLLKQLMPEAILVLTALCLLAVAVGSEAKKGISVSRKVATLVSVVGTIVSALALFRMPEVESGSGLIVMDPLARMAKLLVLSLGVLAVFLPTAKNEVDHRGEYHALILFAMTGLLLTCGTTHLLMLFVALELASLSLYLLTGFSRTARAAEAALKYFLFGGVSAAFLLFGLSLTYGFAHTANMEVLAAAIVASPQSPLAMTGLAMILVGIGFKLAAAPFHYWAPDVYQGAPATSVALIAGASKLVGLLVLIRVLMTGFDAACGSAEWGRIEAGWSPWLAVLAAVSIVFGNVLALAQQSVRRLLAYSAVANTGYLLVGIAAHGVSASGAAVFYVLVYGLATLGALAVTAAVERDQGNDSPSAFAGLVHRSPMQAVGMLVFLASLAGVPPLAGFIGKFALFSSALATTQQKESPGLVWLVGLAAVMSAISLYYYLSVLKQVFVRDGACADSVPISFSHRLAVLLPACALVVLGVFPALLLDPILLAVAETLGSR